MFDGFVAYHARLRPGAPAVVSLGGRLDFAGLDAAVSRAAAAMSFPPGACVAIENGDPLARWVAALALARRGVCSTCAADHAATHRFFPSPLPLREGRRKSAACCSPPAPPARSSAWA